MYTPFIKSLPNSASICCAENTAWWITCFSPSFWRPGKANTELLQKCQARALSGWAEGLKPKATGQSAEHPGRRGTAGSVRSSKETSLFPAVIKSRSDPLATGGACVTFCRIGAVLVPALEMLHISTSKAAVIWSRIHYSQFLPGI